MTKTKKQKQFATYREATKPLKLILCNEVKNLGLSDYTFRLENYIDDEIIKEVNESKLYNTEEEKEEALKDKAFDYFCSNEVCQYYLTGANQYDVDYLTNKYGLEFAYCDDLNLWVLLVTFWGTSWDNVQVEVKELKEY